MLAQLFFAVAARKGIVCLFVKALGVKVVERFPKDEEQKSNKKQTPCKHVGNKYKRSAHHGVIPVVYSAAAATLVFHKPGLEGTKEEYAYHIAHRVEKTDEDKDSLVDKTYIVKESYNAVEQKP